MKRVFLIIALIANIFIFITNSYAQTYYVKKNGNDGLDGLSDATAWKSISKVNNYSFNTGDDVYFKCGDTWTVSGDNVLRIDWSGTSSNHAVIGAYYGSGTIGVSGTKPTFDGGSYVTGSYPSWTWHSVAPTYEYRGLIHVEDDNNRYLDITNFRTINSAGSGIWVSDCEYVTVTNCHTSETYANGITVTRTENGTISGNEIYHACRCFVKAGGDGNRVPAAIGLFQADYYTIEKNYVHHGWGEGIGVYYNSDHNTVQYNKIVSQMRVGIYLTAAQNNVIRYNLIYGEGDPIYARQTYGGVPYSGGGLWIDDEKESNITKYGTSMDNEWYGNLVAFTTHGFKFTAYVTGSRFDNSKVYNNTFVGNWNQIESYGLESSKVTNSEIKNNIFWDSENTGMDNGLPSSCSGLTVDYNLWSSIPSSELLQGSHDIVRTGTPLLKKTTGWQDGNTLKISDFMLNESDMVGIELGAPYNMGLTGASDFMNMPFSDQTRQRDSDNWLIGAVVNGGLIPPVLFIVNNN